MRQPKKKEGGFFCGRFADARRGCMQGVTVPQNEEAGVGHPLHAGAPNGAQPRKKPPKTTLPTVGRAALAAGVNGDAKGATPCREATRRDLETTSPLGHETEGRETREDVV